jgi:hypothetical protein
MSIYELKQAITLAEGRTIMVETVVTSQLLLPEVSNPEVMNSLGLDLILLHLFNVMNPKVNGVGTTEYLNPMLQGVTLMIK